MRSAEGQSVGRPPKKSEERRIKQISIGLTEREHALIHARATAAGLRPVDYGRAKLLSQKFAVLRQEASNHLGPLFLAQISRVGNNINQIARRLHANGHPAPPSLEPLLAEIRALLRKAAQ